MPDISGKRLRGPDHGDLIAGNGHDYIYHSGEIMGTLLQYSSTGQVWKQNIP